MSKASSKHRAFSEQKLALLASMLEKEGVPQAPSLKRIPRDGELPLSSAQTGLWLLDQLEPNSAAYNIPVRHDLNGPLNLSAFERSLSEIVRRHEVLRTYYLRVDGRPVRRLRRRNCFGSRSLICRVRRGHPGNRRLGGSRQQKQRNLSTLEKRR